MGSDGNVLPLTTDEVTSVEAGSGVPSVRAKNFIQPANKYYKAGLGGGKYRDLRSVSQLWISSDQLGKQKARLIGTSEGSAAWLALHSRLQKLQPSLCL